MVFSTIRRTAVLIKVVVVEMAGPEEARQALHLAVICEHPKDSSEVVLQGAAAFNSLRLKKVASRKQFKYLLWTCQRQHTWERADITHSQDSQNSICRSLHRKGNLQALLDFEVREAE